MKLIKPSIEILSPTTSEEAIKALKVIELGARNCYKSENLITDDSHNKIIGMLRTLKHESVMEHSSITFRVIGSRAMMSQWTRHRHAAYSIESQRYVNYSKGKFDSEVTFIQPEAWNSWSTDQQLMFRDGLIEAEERYLELIKLGIKAEDARGLLPNATKTEIVCTMNLRSLRNLFQLRCDKHAQAEIRNLATNLLKECHLLMPIIFEDLYKEFIDV